MGNDGQRLVAKTWNQTNRDYPSEVTVDDWIVKTMRHTPDAPAVTFGGATHTYAQLDEASARIASELEVLGIGVECTVGVSMVRSFELCAVLLGILRAGAAYVPLDPTLPMDRLRYMIRDSGAKVLFTHRQTEGAWREIEQLVEPAPFTILQAEVALDSSRNAQRAQSGGSSNPRRLACVLYTSGSTGAPKGVMIEHASMVNLFFWMTETFHLTKHDVFMQNTPFGFDVSLTELFLPLTVGARVILVKPEGHKDPTHMAGLVRQHGATFINFVPSMLRAFIEALEGQPLASLRALLSMGEPLARDAADAVTAALPNVGLHNLYGLTETTVHATLWTFREGHEPRNQVLVGRPLANTKLYILDEQLRQVEVGEVGEIYIAGKQLARGYLNREELTKARFLPNPFESDSIIYKTGDLGRFSDDGNVEFLGRNDFQVKLRGLRIELGEIEHVLASVDGVRQAAVVLMVSENGEPQLVAYLRVGSGVNKRPAIAELQNAAARALPAYMIPSAFVVMDAFPLNPNGKLDRGRLPAPDRAAYGESQYEPPIDELEVLIASEWSKLLGPIGGAIGRNDVFMSLGGHSLLAVQFVSRMRQSGWLLTLADVFEGKTLAKIAECAVPIRRQSDFSASAISSIPPRLVLLSPDELEGVYARFGGRLAVQDVLPITPFQEGLLFHHKAATSGDPYLISRVLSFGSKVLLESYVAALQAVVDRHDALRTCILHRAASQPIQVVLRSARVTVGEVAATGATQEEVVAGLVRRYGAFGASLDLESAPVLGLHACEWRDTWFLVEVRHHIFVDDHSIVVGDREATAWLRNDFAALGQPASLREHVAEAAKSSFGDSARAFYRTMLGGVDTATLPYGLEVRHGFTPATGVFSAAIPAALAERLNKVVVRFGTTPATLFHLVWSLVLSRLTGQAKVVFGTVLADHRGVEGADAAVGPFMNTLPIALTVVGRVDELVHITQRLLASLLRHVGTRLVDAQGCAEVSNGRPLFSSLLNFRFATLAEAEQDFAPGICCVGEESLATYPLAMTVEPVGRGFQLQCRVDCSVDPASVCELVVHGVDQLVGALEQRPESLAEELDVVPPARLHQLLRGFNPVFEPRRYERIERLFEAVAAQMPHSVALVESGLKLTYAELNQRANRIARWLVRRGVVAGDAVALVFSRGIDLICFQTAALKVGAVYVPLDSSHPTERLRRQIDTASAVLTVVDSAPLAERIGGAANVVVRDPSHWGSESAENTSLELIQDPTNQVAYLMFTSGSTGEPKGVAVTHAGVVRLVTKTSWISVSPGDQVTVLSNPAFDGSTFEVWTALLNGATGHVIEQALLFEPRRLQDYLLAVGMTAMLLPTALFHQYGDQLARAYAKLKYLIVGGERLQAPVVDCVFKEGRPRHLVNAYGPTETAVIATTYELPKGQTVDSIPIGRPIDQTSVYLMDARGRLVPPGVVGEIWVSGDGVARGYVNADESATSRFGLDPFCPERGRIYRTGDFGRHRLDGNIEYVGRVDSQMKIRGHRVELGEIEAAIRRVRLVRDVAVVVLPATRDGGEARLAAFVCLGEHAGDRGIAGVRKDLEEALPSFMVPAFIVEVPKLPVTPNGKVDIEALVRQGVPASSGTTSNVGSATLAEKLTQMWSKALGVNVVGEHDDFFELGGHSLLAMTLVDQMRQDLGLNVDVPMLFEHSSPSELLKAVSFCE